MSAAVSARGLVKRFGAVTALRGIDLDVERGGALAVLGRNGAGKSTLLRVLSGLARPSAGEVSIEGLPQRGGAARRVLGFVGHATMLYAELTARENLVFTGRLLGVGDPGERADHLLEEDGLTEVAHRRVGGLSRGTCQRVAIARALVHDPQVVLLDEPFTGLDRRSADRLGARLGRLRTEGRTLVLVTHEIPQVPQLAESAVVMEGGRIIHSASAPDLDPRALEH